MYACRANEARKPGKATWESEGDAGDRTTNDVGGVAAADEESWRPMRWGH